MCKVNMKVVVGCLKTDKLVKVRENERNVLHQNHLKGDIDIPCFFDE